jgi:uncharacterized membrane protein
MQELTLEREVDSVPRAVSAVALGRGRLDSIDLLRGLIMAIMALDHVRDFFSNVRFNPTDLEQTNTALFLTRWISHYCAPLFIFLAGTSAFLAGRRKTRPGLAWFLLSRGLWIILLELTLVRWGWSFNLDYHFVWVQVFWAIGWSMIVLAGLVFLPLPVIAAFGIALIAGHNAFDGIHAANLPSALSRFDWLWAILHTGESIGVRYPSGGGLPEWPRVLSFESARSFEGFHFSPAYPLVPWIGVMALGYCFGTVFLLPRARRRKWLFGLGALLTLAFVFLRAVNVYGDPHPWSWQADAALTVLSFINCHKYPPSLLYLLMTLGPAIIALACFDHDLGPAAKPLVTFGRVPMFYYLLHVPLIHGMAVAVALARYGPEIRQDHLPQDYGYSLPVVYLVWILVLCILYPPCRWFSSVKQRHRWAWLSYL